MLSRISLRKAKEVQPIIKRGFINLKLYRALPKYRIGKLPDTPQNEKGEFLVPKLSDLPPHPDESQRDLVNFPRITEYIESPAYRHGFISEKIFKFFYPKTGVTGPYVFATTVLGFLYNKEILIIDEELFNGCALYCVIIAIIYKLGDKHTETILKMGEEGQKYLNAFRDGPLSFYNYKIGEEKSLQKYMSYKTISNDAKQENVHLQLESVYRDRLAEVGKSVKNKLDCALALQRTQNRVEQDHMVNWIVRNVKSSITPAQEAATLKKCIADLAAMAKA